MDDFKAQDVEFEEVDKKVDEDKERNIRGKALYFSTSQVAHQLGIRDSKVRFYTQEFKDLLNIEVHNTQKRYTEADIEKLKFLVELKQSGMTIKQIQDYTQEVDFENEEGIKVKESNPLSIQTLSKALLQEQQKQMQEFKTEVLESISLLIQEQSKNIRENNDNLRDEILEQVAVTVDDIIDEKLTANLDEQERRSIEREANMIKNLHETLERRKSENETTEKVGFFSRLFGK